jgi:hypothetical protein
MLKPVIAAAALAVALATPALADNHAMKTGTIKMESAHDAATTLDRLEKIFAEKGHYRFHPCRSCRRCAEGRHGAATHPACCCSAIRSSARR